VYRILHLLPHAGGGVGTVLRAFLKAESNNSSSLFQHEVLSLESLNIQTQKCLNNLDILWWQSADQNRIEAQVKAADIVLVHWWNHPLLMHLLTQGLPESRLIFWSHVNGYTCPQAFFPALFDLADLFVFASYASLDAPVVKRLSSTRQQRLIVIPSCAGIPPEGESYCVKETDFQAGYIGTVEPAKMHPEFLDLCVHANLSLPLQVAGGPAHELLQAQAKQKGWEQQFNILGPVTDPLPLFRRLHAFAYPLVPQHYGTGEQVLIEAMAYGAVPVVFANPPEKALIRHMETGILAETSAEFSKAIQFLEKHPEERERMALAGHKYVLEYCSIEKTQIAFQAVFSEGLNIPKKKHQLHLPEIEGVRSYSPFHLYLSSCDTALERDIALDLVSGKEPEQPWPVSFYYLTRGAPAHYLSLLDHDHYLAQICSACELI